MFMWIERKIEGNRSARMRLDRQGPSLEKFARKSAKHLVWGAVALWTGFTFVSYFTPVRTLAHEVVTLGLGPWEWFWILFYSFATYGNAGWMREQVCKYMCPYARFQSSMFDKDTLIITYDTARGEPRGPKMKKPDPAKKQGDCIDCTMCVQVCPTGIDIRKGLQYECIGCAACVDACNSVMDKVGSPRGLIRYSTEHAMAEGLTNSQIWQRMRRPRVLIYGTILFLISCAAFTSLAMRNPLKLDVLRDRGAMGREVEDGMIENVYRLQIMNTSEREHHYRVQAAGLPSIKVVGGDEIRMASTETRSVPLRLRIPAGEGQKGSNKITISLQALDEPELKVRESAVFIVPR
jgi:cytochrome c oxidase accessory protein FixG